MRIKKKRPKGKTVLKKRPNKIEEKRNGTKKQKQRALSIYEKNAEISVVAKVEFPISKKLFHLVVNPGTWSGARP